MSKKSYMTINGRKVEVSERLGFNHDIGMYAACVLIDGKEQYAVKPTGGVWRLWTTNDRVQPLIEQMQRDERRAHQDALAGEILAEDTNNLPDGAN